MNAVLRLISEWANAAENEGLDQEYFYPAWHLDRIIQDNRIVVIGRKGAGKTALANHIASLDTADVAASGVKLASLDIPSGPQHESVFGNFEVLAKGWSKVILEAVATLVLDSMELSAKDRQEKEKQAGIVSSSSQGGFIDRIRHIRLNANLLGVDIGFNQPPGTPAPSIDQHNENLRSFIETNFWSSKKKLVVVFDGLDE
jgi:hypothetical protein